MFSVNNIKSSVCSCYTCSDIEGKKRVVLLLKGNHFLCGTGNDDNGFPGVIGAKASLVSKLFIYRRQNIPSNSIQSNHYYCRI